ncbi:MAG TPA: type II toxin-antitoxin system RelE/ParE family toxin [Rhizomicrobium sp.]|jgi:putative addiction module killer protein|nr:type II toxin-antitoxin system RelE/ParE family toxin [Rhizomicrobium sp.]
MTTKDHGPRDWNPRVFGVGVEFFRDARARAEIARRVRRLALANPGDVKPVGGGVSELRIHYGPGYRAYYVQRGSLLIVLLCGGDKRAQAKDIAMAVKLAKEV